MVPVGTLIPAGESFHGMRGIVAPRSKPRRDSGLTGGSLWEVWKAIGCDPPTEHGSVTRLNGRLGYFLSPREIGQDRLGGNRQCWELNEGLRRLDRGGELKSSRNHRTRRDFRRLAHPRRITWVIRRNESMKREWPNSADSPVLVLELLSPATKLFRKGRTLNDRRDKLSRGDPPCRHPVSMIRDRGHGFSTPLLVKFRSDWKNVTRGEGDEVQSCRTALI